MNLTRILSIILFLSSLGLAYYLYDNINSTIEFQEYITDTEEKITDKLAIIREAEKAFLEQYGHYTANWDSLINFIENGQVPITVRTETITQLSYGEEQVDVKIDTVGYMSAKERIFKRNFTMNASTDGIFMGFLVKPGDYVVKGSNGKDGAPGFRYGGGYISKIKERNSESFVWMSQDAGAPVNTGVEFGGALFSVGNFSIGAIDYYCEDVINIGYAEAKYTWPVTQKFGLLFAAQFTDQRSVGDDALKGYAFSVNQVGVKTEMSYGGAMLTLAFTTDTSGADLQNRWSSYGLHQGPGEGFQSGKGESLSCEGVLRLHAPWF